MGFKAVQLGVWHANDDFFEAVKRSGEIEQLVLVEPFEEHQQIINDCYKDYSFELVQKAIVVDDTPEVTMYISGDNGGFGAVSSTSEQHIKKHGVPVEGSRQIPAITLPRLLDERGLTEIDLMAIDIEGMDQNVITSLDLNKYKIKRIVYEYIHLNQEEVNSFLVQRGYEQIQDPLWTSPLDAIYERVDPHGTP